MANRKMLQLCTVFPHCKWECELAGILTPNMAYLLRTPAQDYVQWSASFVHLNAIKLCTISTANKLFHFAHMKPKY